MSSQANALKKKCQNSKKRNPKRKTDQEMELSENEVRNKPKRNKKNPKHLSSEVTDQAKHINLQRIKIASNKQRTWRSLPKSTGEYLQSMIDSAIIAVLSNIRGKEQIQYHLNLLKKRLLQQCETLKVPPRKVNYLTNASNLLKMERAQEKVNKEGLALLQEEIDKIEETTESMTENIQSLKNKIQILMHKIEEEEEKIKQSLHVDNNRALSLPELPQESLKAPVLQNEILSVIPNQNALLKDLDILYNSSPVKNMSTFIEQAYEKLDAS